MFAESYRGGGSSLLSFSDGCKLYSPSPVEQPTIDDPELFGMAIPMEPTIGSDSLDVLLKSDENGQVAAMLSSPAVYDNAVRRVGKVFTRAERDSVVVFDEGSHELRRIRGDFGSVLTSADTSDSANVVVYSFNVGDGADDNKLGKHTILIVSEESDVQISSNSFPSGLTVCDDGRVFWFDADEDFSKPGIRAVGANLDGQMRTTGVSNDMLSDASDGVFDCSNGNGMLVIKRGTSTDRMYVTAPFDRSHVKWESNRAIGRFDTTFLPNFSYTGRFYSMGKDGILRSYSVDGPKKMTALNLISMAETLLLFLGTEDG